LTNALRPETRLVWVETPTNPFLRVVDISRVAATAREHGALVTVDNTFATPYFQQPLDLGADLVLHSSTKYLGGHSDAVGGAIVMRSEKLYERLKFMQNALGPVPGPFDAYLFLRGIKTLAVRMDRHASNAALIAAFLEADPRVERVWYPGLESHPQHDVARKQMSGFGGMVSFIPKGE